MKNHVKAKLKSGKPAIGVTLSVMHPEIIRTIANSGFDWVLYDTEHGPWSIETVNDMIQRTSGSTASPIIRVVWNDMNAIKRALDTGTYGIIVPWVSSRKMAEEAVRYSRYPPEGLRGCAPGRPARAWGVSPEEYLEIANEEVLVAVQIEREEAIEKVEEIVSVEGIDATWLGPADLSASMGLRGQFFHPKVLKAMERMVEACIDAGVAPGIAAGVGVAKFGIDYVNKLIEQGFRFINIGVDLSLLELGCKDFLGKVSNL
ncbi:4-hydroxy-2-oxo-heptane-1,7-dioate aldolase [Candidatus Bathyarchaeota archaeon]|nr:4-hydroxy-2-oxo-heptane-1,7-dioate aldolase [Candidatus Bathyarchaeota archaeon]